MLTIKAHFDGKVFVPDEPVDLPTGQPIEVRIQPPAKKGKKNYMTAGELVRSEAIGIWKDRKDMEDSVAYVRELRRRAERREI